MNAEQVAMQQIHRLQADPVVQQLCAVWLNQVGHDPRVQQLSAGARTPFEAYVRVMVAADPATLEGDINHIVGLQDQEYGPVPATRNAGPPAQATGGIDWAAEFPDSKVLKAWQELPAHSRLRQTAKSPQSEALARQSFAKAGVVPFRGMTEGETLAALLNYAAKTKALSGGDRRAYDALARHLGGVLGDGESIRTQVEAVRQIHFDDRVLNRIAEKDRAAEAEAAKHRSKPPEQPTFDKKFTPQSAIKPKEKPRDTTRDEVARQLARQKAGWELPEKRRPEPLNMTISDRDHFHTAMALVKHKGESPGRVFSRLSPALRREMIGELRDNGFEPASSRSSGNSSSGRHWVPAQPSSSERHWVPAASNPSSGGYSGASSEFTGSEGAAETGSGT